MINGQIWYQPFTDEANEKTANSHSLDTLLINKLAVEDRKGNR